MLRAATRSLGHRAAAGRLQCGPSSLVAQQRASAAAMTMMSSSSAAAGEEMSSRWPINLAIGAASIVSALGVGIAVDNSMDNGRSSLSSSSIARCETLSSPSLSPSSSSSSPPSSSWTMGEEVGGDEDLDEDDKLSHFRIIPHGELDVAHGIDGGRSERALGSALANGLFDAEGGGGDGDNPGLLLLPLATSSSERDAALENDSDSSDYAPDKDGKKDKDVVLRRIKTVRRNGLGKNQVYTQNMYFYQSAQIREHLQNKFRLFALPSSENLGREMAYLLGTSLNAISVGSFTDGETSVKVEDTIRGKEIFVVCTTMSTNSIMELLLTISALRRGSAKRICAVMPYYGYSRQDRRTGMKREPIAAADMAKLLEEMGVDSVICVDLHNPLLKGFFSPTVPVDHLMPGPVAAAYFYEELFGKGTTTNNAAGKGEEKGDEGEGKAEDEKKKEAPKITVVAAHENQVFRANGFRNALQKLSGIEDIRVALISNSTVHGRNSTSKKGTGTSTTLVGDVDGRKCIIVDDIINTGGTLRSAIEMVDKSGASEVYAWATHGVLHLPDNDAPEKIQAMDCLKYLLISNSVTFDRELPSKIRKLSIAPLLAESVARAFQGESISTMLDVKASGSERSAAAGAAVQ